MPVSRVAELVGRGREFIPSELPTLKDVLRYALHLQEQKLLVQETNHRNYSTDEIVEDVFPALLSQWTRANTSFAPPVVVADRRIKERIRNAMTKARDIANGRCSRASEVDRFSSTLDKLFDITRCRCPITTCSDSRECEGCQNKAHVSCSCPKERKIPFMELAFLLAQRQKTGELSQQQIAGADRKETKRQESIMKRKLVEERKKEAEKKRQQEEEQSQSGSLEEMEAEMPEDPSTQAVDNASSSRRNTVSIPNTALASIRFGASARATAVIASSYVIDLMESGEISKEKSYLMVDANKVLRAKDYVMRTQQAHDDARSQEGAVICIFFDGRKDDTKVMRYNEETRRCYPGVIREEHYAVTSEPDGRYLHHFTPEKSTPTVTAGEQLANGLVQWLTDHGVDVTLVAIGADSTNLNTGWHGGAIHYLEKKLGRRLIWLICALHTNELPLRHLVKQVDGGTASGSSWSGPLGQMLSRVNDLPINSKFQPIHVSAEAQLISLSDDVVQDLSADQRYGYRMVVAITNGDLPTDLAVMKTGPLCHSRWLTTANRFMRLYVSEHGLSDPDDLDHLDRIGAFIVGVYYPCWFQIKCKHNWLDGPRHVLRQLQLLRLQHIETQGCVESYVKSSAWYAHSEMVLQTMLCSSDERERSFAVAQIRDIRDGQDKGDTSVRFRKHPILNMQAATLADLINWEDAHEPVLTCDIPSDELQQFIETPMEVPSFPVHGQSIERCVKEVTAAAMHVYGSDRRDGYIRARAAHRQLMPKFISKKDALRLIQ